MTTNQTVLAEQYHNLTGQIVIEKYFNIENNEIQRIILNYKNRTHFSKMKQDYVLFSLTQFINTEMSFSAIKIFILLAFNHSDPNIPVVAILHSTHVKNIDQVDTSNYKNVYKALFSNLSRYKAIIVSTDSQNKMFQLVLTIKYQS